MKLYRFLILSVLLTGVLLLFGIPAFAAEEQTVYVSAHGDDSAAGTITAPLKTLPAAFKALPYGGKIVLSEGTLAMPATDLPKAEGLITITSIGIEDYRKSQGGSAEIQMNGNIHFRSAVKLENLDIIAAAKDIVFICHGNYVCFGDGLTVTSTGEFNLPGIVGGSSGSVSPSHSYVEIRSGSWFRVRGGARGTSSAAQSGDSVLVVRGGTFGSTFDLGGDSSVDGNVYLFAYGGTFNTAVYGAATAEVTGNVYISVYGGNFTKGIVATGSKGKVDGDMTVNVGIDLAKPVKNTANPVGGTAICNVLSGARVTTDLVGSILSVSDFEELQSKDEAFITSFADAMIPKVDTTHTDRDLTATGSVAKTAVAMPAKCGDLNGNGRLEVLDALLALHGYSKVGDPNADGRADAADAVLIMDAMVKGQTSVAPAFTENRISDTLTLGGNAALMEDGSIRDGIVYGSVSGAYTMVSDAVFSKSGTAAVYFGCDGFGDKMNGYCFEVDRKAATAAIYQIANGMYRTVGKRTLPALGEAARLKLEYGFGDGKNGAALYCADNVYNAQPYPVFDLQLDPRGEMVGVWVSGGTVTPPICFAAPTLPAKVYTNYLLEEFTDVEIYFEGGRYYLFGSKTKTANDGVQCYSTANFRTFKDEGLVLKRENAYGDGVFKAANIVKVDDKYYMFYMTKSDEAGTSRTAYAVADKVNGPYTTGSDGWMMDSFGEYFIGGQPFVDSDGSLYLIYTRVGGGNRLYGAKMTVGNGTVRLSEAKLLLEPTEPWENAKAPVVECGYLIKHNGLYYMLYSGGNYDSTYGTGYAVAKSPLGPYEKYAFNPIMTSNDQTYGVGAATVFNSPDGSEHFIAYIHNYSPTATRPLVSCIDRIRFAKDPNGGIDYIEIAGATVNPQALPSGLGSVTDFPGYQYTRFVW